MLQQWDEPKNERSVMRHLSSQMLKELHLKLVGSDPKFDVKFGDRLNIFTGDNGLSKSFLLDLAWWALTGSWAENPAWPQRETGEMPEISFYLSNQENSKAYQSFFSFPDQRWHSSSIAPQSWSGLIIYARVDGGFSILDPARKHTSVYNFTPDKLWNGLCPGRKVLCKGRSISCATHRAPTYFSFSINE